MSRVEYQILMLTLSATCQVATPEQSKLFASLGAALESSTQLRSTKNMFGRERESAANNRPSTLGEILCFRRF